MGTYDKESIRGRGFASPPKVRSSNLVIGK